ncbi:MAG TPA: PIN domain-containing protein [Candidatus Acidoferrum sp.]|nr:PIN domain-containing protein [Candidatus Acidoferrum sp.]
MNVLIDTSVWSLALRRKNETLSTNERFLVAELSELIREGRARMIGLVRQQLLSGIKAAEQYEKLRLHLRSFPDEVVDTSDYEEAAKAGNRCRAKGVVVSIVDILLCAVANKRLWTIFTTDPDFANYAKVLPLRIHAPRR